MSTWQRQLFHLTTFDNTLNEVFFVLTWCAVGSEVDTTARAQAHLAKALDYLGSKYGVAVGLAQIRLFSTA